MSVEEIQAPDIRDGLLGVNVVNGGGLDASLDPARSGDQGAEPDQEVLGLIAVDDPLGDALEGLGTPDARQQRRGGLGGGAAEAVRDLAQQHAPLGSEAAFEALLQAFLPPESLMRANRLANDSKRSCSSGVYSAFRPSSRHLP